MQFGYLARINRDLVEPLDLHFWLQICAPSQLVGAAASIQAVSMRRTGTASFISVNSHVGHMPGMGAADMVAGRRQEIAVFAAQKSRSPLGSRVHCSRALATVLHEPRSMRSTAAAVVLHAGDPNGVRWALQVCRTRARGRRRV
jgi:hypothetical protein